MNWCDPCMPTQSRGHGTRRSTRDPLSVPCPLTPLEQMLLLRAGEEAYRGGFIDHYIVSLIYPEASPRLFIEAGIFLLVLNCVIYAWIIMRIRAKKTRQ